MRVAIDQATVTLEDIDNHRALDVAAREGKRYVDRALRSASIGYYDGEYAWLSVAELRASGSGSGQVWNESFDAMIEFARSRGWLSKDAQFVRAHLVA